MSTITNLLETLINEVYTQSNCLILISHNNAISKGLFCHLRIATDYLKISTILLQF